MNLREQLRNNSTSRQARLRAFLAERGVTFRALGEALDLCESTVSEILSGRRSTVQHIERMVELGIPAELLPEPRPPLKPGPKRRRPVQSPEAVAADDDGHTPGMIGRFKRAVGL